MPRSLAERKEAARILESVLLTYTEIVKDTLDHNPADVSAMNQMFEDMTRLFRHWHPEHDHPDLSVIEHWERHGMAPGLDLREARARAELNAELAAIKERFLRLRRMHWFGLAFWTLRRFRATQRHEWLEAFERLGAYLANVSELTTALGDALRHEWEERGPWSNWILRDLPEFEAHTVSPDSEFFDTYVVIALRSLSPGSEEPDLPADERVATELQIEEPRTRIDRVLGDERLASAMPDDYETRIEPLVSALETLRARIRTAEDDASMAAPLDAELVREFIEQLESKWRGGRLFRSAFGFRRRVERFEDEPPPEESVHTLGLWVSKRLFLSHLQVIGHTWQADEFARELLRHENRRVLEALEGGAVLEGNGEDIGTRVRRAIEELHRSGYDDLLVLIPRQWQLVSQLGLDLAERFGGASTPPGWIPSERRDDFRGTLADRPVLQLFELPDDRIAVVDLSRWARWQEWVRSGSDLEVTVESLDADEAASLAERDPGDRDVQELTKQIRLSARITTKVASEIVVDDEAAVLWVAIPAEARELT